MSLDEMLLQVTLITLQLNSLRLSDAYICVSKLTIIGSDNGLSPGQRQAIIWTNVRILLIGPLGTNFIEILIEIYIFSFKKMHLKILSGKWRPYCLSLNVLNWHNTGPAWPAWSSNGVSQGECLCPMQAEYTRKDYMLHGHITWRGA